MTARAPSTSKAPRAPTYFPRRWPGVVATIALFAFALGWWGALQVPPATVLEVVCSAAVCRVHDANGAPTDQSVRDAAFALPNAPWALYVDHEGPCGASLILAPGTAGPRTVSFWMPLKDREQLAQALASTGAECRRHRMERHVAPLALALPAALLTALVVIGVGWRVRPAVTVEGEARTARTRATSPQEPLLVAPAYRPSVPSHASAPEPVSAVAPTSEPSFRAAGVAGQSLAFCPQLSIYVFPFILALVVLVLPLALPPEPVERVFECGATGCRIQERGGWNSVPCAAAEDRMNEILSVHVLRRGTAVLHGGVGQASEAQEAFRACRQGKVSRFVTSVRVVEHDWRGAAFALLLCALGVLGTAPRRLVRVRIDPLQRTVVIVEWSLRGKRVDGAALDEIDDVVLRADGIALCVAGGRQLVVVERDTRPIDVKRRTIGRLRRALGVGA